MTAPIGCVWRRALYYLCHRGIEVSARAPRGSCSASSLPCSVAALALAGIGERGIGLGNEANADDVLAGLDSAVFGDACLGKVLALLLVVSVLTSIGGVAVIGVVSIVVGSR
ncbi:hypothetical protein [Amycolatopsis sp. FDAARGOS 1241]|uniref:hypothetical protein n=1 Tax=Amycolatopsis sp. FDAARGOS 1241 TaxID=2778070 RepID=UPI001EF26E24|nr:hypothetical protein [Amycolatopsis sp. FDAARGOS 1241]